jgi:hypothetical protein
MYRTPQQEKAFKAASSQDTETLIRRSQVRSPSDAEYLATETLVSLVRRHPNRDAGTSDFNRLSKVLDKRIEAFAGGFIYRNSSWPVLARDPDYYKEELTQTVRVEIEEESASLSFAEVNFGTFFNRKAVDLLRAERLRTTQTTANLNPTDAETEDEPEDKNVQDLESPERTPEQLAEAKSWLLDFLKVAGEHLTPKEREAMELRHVLDTPIEAKDPAEEETISKMMKLTPQRVRQLLRSAESKLREHLPR